MFKILLIFLFSASLSEARENPFFPPDGAKGLSVTTNKTKDFDPLKRAALTLPDSARLIKEVTVRYQNLDGSIDSRTISLEHSVDWHLPIFISQSYGSNELVGEEKRNTTIPKYEKVADFQEISFYQSDKIMKIRTGDKLLRNFMMIKPHRIVMDFKRMADFRSKSKRLKQAPYKNIRLGNHDGYYRVVIELDGQYQYKIDSEDGAIMLRIY